MILITLPYCTGLVSFCSEHNWGRGGGCHIVYFYLQYISACDHSCLALEAKKNHVQLVLHNCFSARMSPGNTRGVGLTFNWEKKNQVNGKPFLTVYKTG